VCRCTPKHKSHHDGGFFSFRPPCGGSVYFQSSKTKVIKWQSLGLDSRIGGYLGMREGEAARGVCGGQQGLAADVGALRHLERELVVRYGDDRMAATADGAAGTVQVADMLEGETAGESKGCGVARQE
jgi:hypothetical protein